MRWSWLRELRSSLGQTGLPWVAGAALLLGPGACAGPTPAPPVVPDHAPAPEDVLAILHAREANLTSLKALFQVDVQGPLFLFSRRIQGSLLYQRPGSIRITGYTRFGGTAFDFSLHGQSYALRVPDRQDPIVGHVRDDFRRLETLRVPVQLSLRAIEILLGKIEWTTEPLQDVQIEDTAYRYTVPLSLMDSRDGGLQHIWVDRYSARITTIEYRTSQEERLATLTASDFRPVQQPSPQSSSPLTLPFSIKVKDHTTPGTAQFKFLTLQPNVPLSPQNFTLQ